MMLTDQQMRHAIASTLSVLALLAVPTISLGLSCAPRQFTLSEAYEAADSIIVGLITECKEENSSDPWVNGGSDCSFSSLEVLKESVPTRGYSGVTSSSACGLSLQVGVQYLFFLDENNRPMHFSATLSGEPYQVQVASEYLRIIRDFKNGVVKDLAEPWMLRDTNGYCSVSQNIRGNQIRFNRRAPDAPPEPKPDWTQELINGETAYRANVPTFAAETNLPAGMVEIVAFGDIPDYADDALTLSVYLQEPSPDPVRRQATLSVGSKTWSLNRVEMNVSLSRASTHTIIEYHAAGDAAEQILSAVTEPSDIVVFATVIASNNDSEPPSVHPPDQGSFAPAPSNDDYFGPAPPQTSSVRPAVTPNVGPAGLHRVQKDPPQPVLRVESRSTQLSGAIKNFRDCFSEDE